MLTQILVFLFGVLSGLTIATIVVLVRGALRDLDDCDEEFL